MSVQIVKFFMVKFLSLCEQDVAGIIHNKLLNYKSHWNLQKVSKS